MLIRPVVNVCVCLSVWVREGESESQEVYVCRVSVCVSALNLLPC